MIYVLGCEIEIYMPHFFHRSKSATSPRKVKALLDPCTYKNTEIFYPDLSYAKVLKVYDGDTIWIASSTSPDRIARFNLRMLGYDCAELRSSDVIEKHVAKKARAALTQKLFDKLLYVEIQNPNAVKKRDPYGRLLATVWIAERGNLYDPKDSVNQWMIDNRFGVPYDGKGKRPKTDWSLYFTQ